MTDIIKDIEGAAAAASGMRTRLIMIASGAVVLFVLALGLARHFEQRGAALERAGWLKKEAAERAADLALERKHQGEMQQLRDQQQQTARETSEKHESELAQLRRERDADRRRADAAGGLRIPVAACAPGGTVAGTEAAGASGRDDASATTIRLPIEIENDLWAIVNDADEVSAQLRACQGWIRANGFYGPKPDDSSPLLDRMIAAPNHNAEEPE